MYSRMVVEWTLKRGVGNVVLQSLELFRAAPCAVRTCRALTPHYRRLHLADRCTPITRQRAKKKKTSR